MPLDLDRQPLEGSNLNRNTGRHEQSRWEIRDNSLLNLSRGSIPFSVAHQVGVTHARSILANRSVWARVKD